MRVRVLGLLAAGMQVAYSDPISADSFLVLRHAFAAGFNTSVQVRVGFGFS